MEELTHSLLENGTIQKIEQKYVLDMNVSDIQIPDTIQGIIAARMDRLEENLKQTLQVASVIGREFAFRILHAIRGMREEIKSYLLNLQNLEFIYEKSLFPELEYIFKHAFTQEVAYNSLLLARRKEIHEKIGNTIESLYADKLEEFYEILAYHFIKSNNHEKGVEYSKLSAKKAQKSGAIKDAIEYTEWIASCYENLPKTNMTQKQLIDVRTKLAHYYMSLDHHLEAKEAVEPIAKLAIELNYQKRLPAIYTALGGYEMNVQENYEKAVFYLEKALELADLAGDSMSSWIANFNLGGVKSLQCEFEEGLEYFNQCLALSRSAKNLTGISFAKSGMSAYNYVWQGKIKDAYKLSEETLKVAEEKDNVFLKGMSLSNHGISCYFKGFFNEAEEYLEIGTEICKKTSSTIWGALASIFLGFIYSSSEKYEKAKNQFKTGISILEKVKILNSWSLLSNLAILKTDLLNNIPTSSSTELAQSFIKIKQIILKGWSANLIGEILLNSKEGELTEAAKWIQKAIEMDKANGMIWHLGQNYALYSEFHRRKGDRKKAKETLAKSIGLLTKCGATGWIEIYEKELVEL
jgi:tetratricopeptide (TPR) repeat protein